MVTHFPRTLLQRAASTLAAYPKQHLLETPPAGHLPKGWVAGGVSSGVKKRAGAKDLAVVLSPQNAAVAAAVFTRNAFAAAPVQVSRELVGKTTRSKTAEVQGPLSPTEAEKCTVLGLVANSGCANACTGAAGLENAWEMANYVSRSYITNHGKGTVASNTFVVSTGVIGQQLKMDKIKAGIDALNDPKTGAIGSDVDHWLSVSEAVMTTDTFPKFRAREVKDKSGKTLYRFAGFSKGAGMIHPNMATMLSSVFTDAKIEHGPLNEATTFAADRSFNCISIDGDTSTNDTFAVFANGASKESPKIVAVDTPEYVQFRDHLKEFATDLAKLIVRDGEGATKFVTIKVNGARTYNEAKTVANTIATSPLVKTAIYGKDANWGRIVCAIGYSDVPVVPELVNLWFGTLSGEHKLHLFKNGEPHEINEEVASKILDQQDILLTVDLQMGTFSAEMYTCDFSHDYVSINADYRT